MLGINYNFNEKLFRNTIFCLVCFISRLSNRNKCIIKWNKYVYKNEALASVGLMRTLVLLFFIYIFISLLRIDIKKLKKIKPNLFSSLGLLSLIFWEYCLNDSLLKAKKQRGDCSSHLIRTVQTLWLFAGIWLILAVLTFSWMSSQQGVDQKSKRSSAHEVFLIS